MTYPVSHSTLSGRVDNHLAVPFIGEVPVPEEFKYPILFDVTVVVLLYYGPKGLSALRAITTRVTSRESLEEERIKLEILNQLVRNTGNHVAEFNCPPRCCDHDPKGRTGPPG